MAFLDIEKAYDRVSRELIWKTLVNKGTPRRYIRVIRDMYDGAKTRVRTSIENTDFFPVEVRLHQGLAISPYLFALILDELSRGIQEDIPWCLIFVDNIVLVSESTKGLNSRLENWREDLEDNGLKTLLDMIPNGAYRSQLEVETIVNKMREGRLRWFGHVRRKPQSTPIRIVEALIVDGLRRRRRPKLRWEDRVKHDMKELLLSEDMTSNRNEWRARIRLGG
ncbi:ataxia telangiectasia mutated family protein [Tanacetum coccineum]|uniref:Ataxia telangiectasia mutated family protein n=1 Tax=Tanacetum coccineum TaxID=301880 RepID=A0ABQ5AWJ0_9ASTR